MAGTRTTRVALAINPSAAFGQHQDVGPAVARRLRDAGLEVVDLVAADYDALAAATAREVAAGVDALLVVGGDGMVHLGVNAVAGTDIPLGIVPTGTGNDIARTLGISHTNPEAATAQIIGALDREPRVIDAALARWEGESGPEERWFVGALSAGFDALVNERANRMRRPRGPNRYTLAMLIELAKLRPIPYRIELDGEALARTAVLVCAANGTSIGGGMMVTPDAKLDDGLFDVLLVAPLSRRRFLQVVPRVFRGEHLSDPHVEVRRARRVRIDAPIVGYADGERLGPLPMEAEIVPGALRVLV